MALVWRLRSATDLEKIEASVATRAQTSRALDYVDVERSSGEDRRNARAKGPTRMVPLRQDGCQPTLMAWPWASPIRVGYQRIKICSQLQICTNRPSPEYPGVSGIVSSHWSPSVAPALAPSQVLETPEAHPAQRSADEAIRPRGCTILLALSAPTGWSVWRPPTGVANHSGYLAIETRSPLAKRVHFR